jgi:pentose-5-phosphate-3-epimerase
MIKITPAILESSLDAFESQLSKFSTYGSVDIDIIDDDFAESRTVGIETILINPTVNNIKDLGIHLMVNNIQVYLDKIAEFMKEKKLRVYIHQEVLEEGRGSISIPQEWSIGVVLNVDSKLFKKDYYLQFDEVQLMTVRTGFQGGEFQSRSLEKVERLRSMGYNGIVSIDGGVGIGTADMIRKYPIDRVSVGSYFSKYDDFQRRLQDLNTALNG